MSLMRHFGAWQNIVRRSWADDVKNLQRAAASPKTSYNSLANYTSDLLAASMVQPADVCTSMSALAPALDRVVARAATDLLDRPIAPAFLDVLDFGNALECAGCLIAEVTKDVFRDWLARMELRRDDPKMFHVWSAGFAALALDERPTYRRVAARAGEATLPFTAGETFGFNLQALLGHLAAAVENKATFADVTPAWQELLGNYGILYDGASVRLGTLLWMARVVHHRIGGAPLGEVAQRLQDDITHLPATP